MYDFYHEIESGVREYVKGLRNAGINTECSCHHKGYIQCQSLDPTTEIDSIRRVFDDLNLKEYKIEIIHEKVGDSYMWHQFLWITSDTFKVKQKDISLDEAISRSKRIAENNHSASGFFHKQIVEWLEELKELKQEGVDPKEIEESMKDI